MNAKIRSILRKSTLLVLFPGMTLAQNSRPERVLIVEGRPGEAPVLDNGSHAYVDIEALAQIIHGSLSFKTNRLILQIPGLHDTVLETTEQTVSSNQPSSDIGLSTSFMRAGIEQLATMREWASTLAYAIQNGYQVTDDWAATYRGAAEADLSLASAAVSTEADGKAHELLRSEFEAVRNWSHRLVQERKAMNTAKYALSSNALRDDPESQKIITCGRFLATMLGSGRFQDAPSCH